MDLDIAEQKELEMQTVLREVVTYGKKSLGLARKLNFDEADYLLELLHTTSDMTNFYMGDLLNSVERSMGETYSQLISNRKYSEKYLQNMKWVCGAIPPNERKTKELSFAHHSIVAGMESSKDRIAWLQTAIDNDYTTAQLTQAIKDHLGKETKKRTKLVEITCSECGSCWEIEV